MFHPMISLVKGLNWTESLLSGISDSSEFSAEGALIFATLVPSCQQPCYTLLHNVEAVCIIHNWVWYYQQREIIALNRHGTQQQRPESPMVTPPGMRVNTRYINSKKGASSKRMPPVANISSISGTLCNTGVYRHTTEPIFIWDQTLAQQINT